LDEAILRIEGLSVEFANPDGAVKAVRDISLSLREGRTLALTGESSGATPSAFHGFLPPPAGPGTDRRPWIIDDRRESQPETRMRLDFSNRRATTSLL